MASTGMSNTSDTNLASGLGQDAGALPADAAAGPLGEPVDVVEVVEVQTYEATPAGEIGGIGAPLDETMQGGMPWWLVPAIAVPVVAGTTAGVVLLLRSRQKPAPAATANKLAKQSRDWLASVRSAQAAQSAVQALQQGMQSVRSTAQGLPGQAAGLRDRSGDWLGGIAESDAVKNALDSVTSFWNTNTPQAKQAVKEQGRGAAILATPAVAAVLARLPGNLGQDRSALAKAQAKQAAAKVTKAANKASDRAEKLRDAAKPAMTAAAVKAAAKAAKAAEKTNRAAKRAGKRANRTFKRTRAFTFAMLVSAVVTYTRMWRQRLLEKETRETAGGRLVRDA